VAIIKDKTMDMAQRTGIAEKISPTMLLSLFNTIESAGTDRGLTSGQKLFSLFYSPLFKLSLTQNGDFIVTSKSSRGGDVKLFNQASDTKRFSIKVSDPLASFTGIIALGIVLDAARIIIPDPATRETLRLAKIICVSGLSLAVILAKEEEMKKYFVQNHDAGVWGLYQSNEPLIDNMLFEKPVASIIMPGKEPDQVFGQN
ncbi:MAG: hypothetical protein ABIA63_03145, partial [bacterium]